MRDGVYTLWIYTKTTERFLLFLSVVFLVRLWCLVWFLGCGGEVFEPHVALYEDESEDAFEQVRA